MTDPIHRIEELLAGVDYVADRRLATATFLALELGKYLARRAGLGRR